MSSEQNRSLSTLKKNQIKKGVVVSNKMEKTVVVEVSTRLRHPRYKKVIIRNRKYYAHDASNALNIGDEVTIRLDRPISKLKSWRVLSTNAPKESE
jgi:small subunit ribosomal protein S17